LSLADFPAIPTPAELNSILAHFGEKIPFHA